MHTLVVTYVRELSVCIHYIDQILQLHTDSYTSVSSTCLKGTITLSVPEILSVVKMLIVT